MLSDSPGGNAVCDVGGGNKSKAGGDLSGCDASTILDIVEDGGEGGAKCNGSLKSKRGGGFKNPQLTFSSTLFEQLDEQSMSLSGVASPLELIEFFLLDKNECLFF